LNNLIKNSKSEYIKFIFQDDFPFSNDLISKTIKAIEKNPDNNWFICGSNNTTDNENFYNYVNPYFNSKIYLGKNTLGSPSVLTVKNSKELLLFDNRFIWLLDCAYYHILNKKFGPPMIIDEVLITCRVHSDQLTDVLTDTKKIKEVFLANKIFNKSFFKFYIFIEIFFSHLLSKLKVNVKRIWNLKTSPLF
jgi:hypothetical protein